MDHDAGSNGTPDSAISSFDPALIFWSVVVFDIIMFLWGSYLDYRQVAVVSTSKYPADKLAGAMDEQQFEKARLYALDNLRFGGIYGVFSQVISIAALVCNFLPLLWTYSGSLISRFDLTGGEVTQGAIFLVLGQLITLVISLPWKLYKNFVLEEKHGFNKYTYGFYFKDLVKKFVVGQVIIQPAVALLCYIIKAGGSYAFVYAGGFVCALSLFIMLIYHDFIAPIFDTFHPLPDGALKDDIEKLAKQIDFPLCKLLVVEGSKRSAHSNAYFFGFGKVKKIVLFDTIIEGFELPKPVTAPVPEKDPAESTVEKKKTGCKNAEVVAVLGHELGHWYFSHNLRNLVISQANTMLTFGLFALIIPHREVFQAFGFDTEPTLIGLLLILQYIFAPYDHLVTFLFNAFVRRMEYQADDFSARRLGYGDEMCSALMKLNNDNLSFPLNDPWYSTYHFSHPPTLERIAAINRIKKTQ